MKLLVRVRVRIGTYHASHTRDTSSVLNKFWPSGVFKVNICGKVLLVHGSFVKAKVNLRTSL